MILKNILPQNIDWSSISEEKISGETGYVIIKIKKFGNIQIRKIEYSQNYKADHWCDKGHIVYVLHGELIIEYKEHSSHIIKSGMSYVVGDKSLSHKAVSMNGATVLIID